MWYRPIVGIIVGLWLAVNLLGCLAIDDSDLHIASSSTMVSTSLDTPDDLKHQSVFPLPVHGVAFNATCDPSSLRNGFLRTPSVSRQDFKPHRVNCVFLL